MKRKASILLAALLSLCLLCTACGKNVENTGDDAPQNDPNEGLGGGSDVLDVGSLKGTYLPVNDSSEWIYLEIEDDGTWMLYGENADISGWIGYDDEYDAFYAYDNSDGSGCLFYVDVDGTLYFASYGYFRYNEMDGEENLGGEPSSYWSWDSELCQRNVSEFEGIWYFDGDLSAETYIVIDGGGNWSYYQRAPGAEPSEMDCGTFSYSTDEASTYYADSTMYDGVSYRVFELDEDVLVWGDEGSYYLME